MATIVRETNITKFVDGYVKLWDRFRVEIDDRMEPISVTSKEDLKDDLGDPSQILQDRLQDLSQRGEEIVQSVRNWMQGIEQSAMDDRVQVEGLLDRCIQNQAALRSWAHVFGRKREEALDQLLRVFGSLSSTIRHERPEESANAVFCVEWQESGDGLGYWTGTTTSRKFSLLDTVRDLASMMGRLEGVRQDAVAQQIVADIRTGELTLPLLVRRAESTRECTKLSLQTAEDGEGQGLLLPENEGLMDAELFLREEVPEIARVYEDSLLVAAHQDFDLGALKWSDFCQPAAAMDERVTIREMGQACKTLLSAAAAAAPVLIEVLAQPLMMISQSSRESTLRQEADAFLSEFWRIK